jgi:hypothetical protein
MEPGHELPVYTMQLNPFTQETPVKRFGAVTFRTMLARCGADEKSIKNILEVLDLKGVMNEIDATQIPPDVRLELLTPDTHS